MCISVCRDQDTITGFLLTGVGDASAGQPNNYMVVDQGAAQPLPVGPLLHTSSACSAEAVQGS